ncbi:hypothetical protein Ancab_011618 [Ancistrocladus abbreviatus]
MVLHRRLDYGFIGYQVPPFPRGKRSSRKRDPYRKKVEDNQTFAFDLLATVAGKLLLEEEGPPTVIVTGPDHGANDQDGFNRELHDKHELPKVEPSDPAIAEIGRGQDLGFSHDQHCKEILGSQHSACSGPGSGLTASDCFAKISSDDQIVVNIDNGDFKSPRKFEGSSPCQMESCTPKLEDDVKQHNQCQQVDMGDLSIGTGPGLCCSDDPNFLDRKLHVLVSSDSSGKVSYCRDHYPCGSLFLCRNNVTLVSRDDDENSSGCSQPSTIVKPTMSPSHIGDCRIKKLFPSRYWRVAPRVKDGDLSDMGGEIPPVYHNRKNGYKRQRSQRIYPLKKRKLFEYGSVPNSDGGISSESMCESPEKARGVTASSFVAIGHGAAGDNASILSRDPHVKLRIKSFRVPELFIEIPGTATVGSLKRTVLEAVTSLLGDGLHVGVIFQGKKIRDDDRTLLQSGISHDNKVDALGFTLEPSPSQAFPLMHSEGHPLMLSDDAILRCPPATSMIQQGVFHASSDNPVTNLGTSIESDHDSAPSPADISEKGSIDSRALVPVPEANAQVLAAVPLHPKSKRTDVAQRRSRRPFSVSEVEALVQAVEKLGTGRWRDVKLRAFDNMKHRTYVDLKDKWKTLVHTARISPQQRRGEPVPQELLDRVLTAHAYWSQQQAKQQLRQQSEACLLA